MFWSKGYDGVTIDDFVAGMHARIGAPRNTLRKDAEEAADVALLRRRV